MRSSVHSLFFRRPVLGVAGLVSLTAVAGVSAWMLVRTDGKTVDERQATATTSRPDLRPIPRSPKQGEDAFNWLGPAGSLEQLVGRSDAVVVGRFIGIKGSEVIMPSRSPEPSDPHSPGVMFTLLVFEVDDVLKGEPPKGLLVRQTGDLARGLAPPTFPAPKQGETLLVFLNHEPFGDGTWASYYGPWGRMHIDGGQLKYVGGGERNAVEFMQAKTLAEAVTKTKAEVQRQAAARP